MRELVGEFGALHGIADLRPDDDGYLEIEFDDSLLLVLQLNRHTGLITIFATLGTIPEEHAGAVMREILHANLFWQGTGGATIGADPDDGQIIMAEQFLLEGLEVSHFEAVIDEFVRHIVAWRQHLVGFVTEDGAGESDKPRMFPRRDIIRG